MDYLLAGPEWPLAFLYLFEPTPDLSAALAEIDFDQTGIFWARS